MSLLFRFNLDRAIDVTSLILSTLVVEEISAWKLLRLIYLIERCSLRDFDRPIIGGTNILRGSSPICEELYKILFWFREVPIEVSKNQELWDNYYFVNRGSECKNSPIVTNKDSYLRVENLNEEEDCLIRNSCEYLKCLELEDTCFIFPETEPLELDYQEIDNCYLLKVLGKTEEEIEEIKRWLNDFDHQDCQKDLQQCARLDTHRTSWPTG